LEHEKHLQTFDGTASATSITEQPSPLDAGLPFSAHQSNVSPRPRTPEQPPLSKPLLFRRPSLHQIRALHPESFTAYRRGNGVDLVDKSFHPNVFLAPPPSFENGLPSSFMAPMPQGAPISTQSLFSPTLPCPPRIGFEQNLKFVPSNLPCGDHMMAQPGFSLQSLEQYPTSFINFSQHTNSAADYFSTALSEADRNPQIITGSGNTTFTNQMAGLQANSEMDPFIGEILGTSDNSSCDRTMMPSHQGQFSESQETLVCSDSRSSNVNVSANCQNLEQNKNDTQLNDQSCVTLSDQSAHSLYNRSFCVQNAEFHPSTPYIGPLTRLKRSRKDKAVDENGEEDVIDWDKMDPNGATIPTYGINTVGTEPLYS
jgi:hypothetical protein